MKFINLSKITGFYKISKEHVFLIDDIQTNIGPKNCIVLNKELFQIYNDNFNITHGMIQEFSGNFYYVSDDGDLYCFNPFKHEEYKIFNAGNGRIFSLNSNKFIYQDDKSPLYDLDSLTTIRTKSYYIEDSLIWKVRSTGMISIHNENIFLNKALDPDVLKRSNTFEYINYSSGLAVFSFKLEDYIKHLHSAQPFDHPHKVGKPLGIYHDQLWFEMDNYGLMCLHKDTGELLHYLRDLPYATGETYRGMVRAKGHAVIPYTDEAILLHDEGKIVCFAIFYYWELDLSTMKITYHYLKDYFEEVQCYTFGARFKPLEVAEHLIYMVDTQHKKIGVFNRNTLRYDHIEPLPEGSGAPRSIEKHGDRLYVDTFGKKLLVYQIDAVI